MLRFAVRGMSCDHCVRAVTEAVHGVDPVAAVSVSLENGQVEVTGSRANPAAVAAAIAAEGYDATPLQG